MNEKLVRRFHWFWIWQDTEQEIWLGEMSRQGLHLKALGALGSFLFTKGPAGEYSYRLDYNQNKPSGEYFQIILDAGWEYIGKKGGWHYWRKAITDGRVPELFTDAESKIQKYQRLFTLFATSSPGAAVMYIIGAAFFRRHPGVHPDWFIVLYLGLFMAWLLVAGFNSVMVFHRISQLKKSKGV